MHKLWTATKIVTPLYDHLRIVQDANVRKSLKLLYKYTSNIHINVPVQTRNSVNMLLIFVCWLKESQDDKQPKQVNIWIRICSQKPLQQWKIYIYMSSKKWCRKKKQVYEIIIIIIIIAIYSDCCY